MNLQARTKQALSEVGGGCSFIARLSVGSEAVGLYVELRMRQPRFLSICLNPVLQKTLTLHSLVSGRVNRLSAHRLDASGKGINVSRVLTQLGQNVSHLTQLGGRFRDRFLELAAHDGLSVFWSESGSEIRFCYTLLERGTSATTELVEESVPVQPGTEAALEVRFEALVQACDCVILSGSKAAGLSSTLFPSWVSRAKALGKCVILDIRGDDLRASLEFQPDIIKPNLEEFIETFVAARPAAHELLAVVEDEMMSLARRYACSVIVTQSAAATLVAASGGFSQYPVRPISVVNQTGSGDAFTAGLARALGHGESLRDAVLEGQRCGALNAELERPGVIR